MSRPEKLVCRYCGSGSPVLTSHCAMAPFDSKTGKAVGHAFVRVPIRPTLREALNAALEEGK